MPINLTIDPQRLWDTLNETASFGSTAKGGIKRLALTDEDRQVRDWFKAQCEVLGCSVEIDEVGNMFARRPGRNNALDPICMGSHLDTQPTGGKFDGVLGVLGALEVMRTLHEQDYETNAPVFDGKDIRVVDVGDVPGNAFQLGEHYKAAEAAIRKILKAGAFPVSIGGDHGIPIPIFRALDNHGPNTLVHLDAHLDWRNDVNGVATGYSSTIRRASEMKHIDHIFQFGVRGSGSARPEEVEIAKTYGAVIITSAEWDDRGIAALLDLIPDGGNYYLTVDADGFDPSVMPAVALPQPGGVKYRQAIELIKGLVSKGRLVGMDIVEITPQNDVNEISSITAGHLILNLIGAAVRAGYFEK
ncbi:arginase family protein [Mesorhizobium sp. A623]